MLITNGFSYADKASNVVKICHVAIDICPNDKSLVTHINFKVVSFWSDGSVDSLWDKEDLYEISDIYRVTLEQFLKNIVMEYY